VTDEFGTVRVNSSMSVDQSH